MDNVVRWQARALGNRRRVLATGDGHWVAGARPGRRTTTAQGGRLTMDD
jgi:hypothetical protein